MDVYEELKKLFNVKQDTWNLFYKLKQCTQYESNDNLYLFRNNRSKLQFVDYLKRHKIEHYNSRMCAFWNEFDGKKTYLRTIKEIKNIDGYRFKNVYFMD